jgi:dihydroxyacetone kinase
MATKRFLNTRETLVTEAIDGLVRLSGGRLARLDGYPHIKVVVRARLDPSKVALVSGGGSGHEPAHAGFVGAGMLSAAVCGEVFASPSVDAVLAAILAVTHEPGCLLIVKNYTGDRLNFGLAAERARALGKRVELVLVADDVALPDAARPRGVAGTLFVHKIAGSVAERGASLDEVAAAARGAAAAIGSLGVSLEGCTIPGAPPTERLAADEGELGLGIHGEPGVEKIALQSVRSLVALMTTRLLAALPRERAHGRFALLINDLGAVPPIEMSVIAHELLGSALAEHVDLVIGPAPLMTSLDMNGFSISLLELDAQRRTALLAPCDVAAWPGAHEPRALELRPLPARAQDRRAPASAHARREALLLALIDRAIAIAPELDALDARVGDGDTGSTLARGAQAIRARLASLPLADAPALLRAIADVIGESMGGSSGVLLAIGCTACSVALAGGSNWATSLQAGADAMARHGGAALGDRTLLDALVPALACAGTGADWHAVAGAARAGADATAELPRARAGRSAYLRSDALLGTPDPGAIAIAALFEAAAAHLRNSSDG